MMTMERASCFKDSVGQGSCSMIMITKQGMRVKAIKFNVDIRRIRIFCERTGERKAS